MQVVVKVSGLFILLALLVVPLHGQSSKSDLEGKRNKLIRQLELTQSLLKKSQSNEKKTLADLNLLETQIEKRNDLVNVIEEELVVMENEQKILSDSISYLQSQEKEKKETYAAILNKAHINNRLRNPVQILLDGLGALESFKKWIYLRQYNRFVERKLEELSMTRSLLTQKKSERDALIEEQKDLLASATAEKENLVKDKSKKAKTLSKLKADMKSLRKKQKKQEKQRRALNDAIEKLIIAELSKKESDDPVHTPAAKIKLSGDFKKNKGRLPWPITNAVITAKFGRQSHKELRGIYTNNPGIDMRAASSADVRCIFDGRVVSIFSLAGYKNMVIVRHGEYYTVYSKLKSVSVSKDQVVKRGTILGQAMDSDAGNSNFHFEIWNNKTKVNPEAWLSK